MSIRMQKVKRMTEYANDVRMLLDDHGRLSLEERVKLRGLLASLEARLRSAMEDAINHDGATGKGRKTA